MTQRREGAKAQRCDYCAVVPDFTPSFPRKRESIRLGTAFVYHPLPLNFGLLQPRELMSTRLSLSCRQNTILSIIYQTHSKPQIPARLAGLHTDTAMQEVQDSNPRAQRGSSHKRQFGLASGDAAAGRRQLFKRPPLLSQTDGFFHPLMRRSPRLQCPRRFISMRSDGINTPLHPPNQAFQQRPRPRH